MDLGLQGKVALVTGSYRGTGSGIAELLAQEGASVGVHGFEPGQAAPLVSALAEAGCEVAEVSGDITCDSGADEVAGQMLERFGRVDVLVNNYGVAEGGRWLETATDDWVSIYQKNVLSGVRLVHALVPGMQERGWGRVIWLGTVGAIRPGPRMPNYYASKAVLPNVCVSLAKELAGTGITVNVVSPGIIATREIEALLRSRARKKGWGDDWGEIQRRGVRELFDNPTGRLAEIEEVASLVAFLASERAGYINGAQLRIDGGAADCAV
ncbi:MAG: SDR family oxidoreductase [Deltaproteobacteria bacterium]|nr:SDR family oxidoreductase [Deltaproteobacteria bacterium]MBW2420711.1 SDR family oxidoreductase [Deltaproteobacteria bacterium]